MTLARGGQPSVSRHPVTVLALPGRAEGREGTVRPRSIHLTGKPGKPRPRVENQLTEAARPFSSKI